MGNQVLASGKKRKSQLDFIVLIVFFTTLMVLAFLFRSNSTYNTVQTLKLTEDVFQLNTHLFVLMNNNICGGSTYLPFKTIVAQALARKVPNIEDGNTDFAIDYGGVEEKNINIKTCIEHYFLSLGIEEYYFYTVYKGENRTKIGEQTDGMIEQIEYFSVSDNEKSIATAVLLIKLTPDIKDELPPCPDNGESDCYPRMTCLQYGGKCDDKHTCSKLKCCCKDIPVW